MPKNKKYKCVNCGSEAGALYKTYGPSVLKLTKCDICKGIVDKYVEYDVVIVMIDLVLISREAQRHIIYNTEFQSYWKLFIILIMLETYGVWRSDSLFNIGINSICDMPVPSNGTGNSTHLSIPLPPSWKRQCSGWVRDERSEDDDLFIWEKDFYVQFTSTFSGVAVFILTFHSLITLFVKLQRSEVCMRKVLKAFSLANMSLLFTLPMLVWGNAETRLINYLLVFAYSFVVFYNVYIVLYASPPVMTVLVLLTSNCAKYVTSFYVTPHLRALIT